jgi:hypothetical protein
MDSVVGEDGQDMVVGAVPEPGRDGVWSVPVIVEGVSEESAPADTDVGGRGGDGHCKMEGRTRVYCGSDKRNIASW